MTPANDNACAQREAEQDRLEEALRNGLPVALVFWALIIVIFVLFLR